MDAFDNDREEQLMHQPYLRSLRISPVHGKQAHGMSRTTEPA